jgi:hypothetical protein
MSVKESTGVGFIVSDSRHLVRQRALHAQLNMLGINENDLLCVSVTAAAQPYRSTRHQRVYAFFYLSQGQRNDHWVKDGWGTKETSE